MSKIEKLKIGFEIGIFQPEADPPLAEILFRDSRLEFRD